MRTLAEAKVDLTARLMEEHAEIGIVPEITGVDASLCEDGRTVMFTVIVTPESEDGVIAIIFDLPKAMHEDEFEAIRHGLIAELLAPATLH